MKKFKSLLSTALILAMAMSFMPSVFATETTDDAVSVTYTFKENYNSSPGTDITKYEYEHTGNTWEGVFVHNVGTRTGTAGPHMNTSYGLFMRYVGSWAAIKINVPAGGIYNKLALNVCSTTYASKDIDIYIADPTTLLSDETDVTTLPVLAENIDISKLYVENNKKTVGVIETSMEKYIPAGEHYLIFYVEGVRNYDNGVDSQSYIYNITFSGIKATAPTATFSATTNVDGCGVDVKVNGVANENMIISESRGSAIVATAPSIPGYKFVGWKRGSHTNPVFVSDKNPLEMSLLTNTFVTACYVTESYENEAMVEYYNQNGDFISALAPTETAPTPDAITGFTFEEGNWFIGDDTKLDLSNVTSLTRAVAKHTPNAAAGTVTVNGAAVSDKTAFDSAITPTATEDFTCWMRDGNVVSYNQDYTYYLWDDTAITESTDEIPETAYSGGKLLPLIVLESGDDGAYMIEYDKAEFEVVEVGILFGSENATVDSCTAKYTSQRNSAHGQFTAKGSGTATGYLIYKDGDVYKVIYASEADV